MTLTPAEAEKFIRSNTALTAPPHVPQIRLHLADEAHELWQRTEEELAEIGLPPPFWAFAWAGGQALARHVLDHPALVAGRRVLDLASGSGLVGIAAMKAGAAAAAVADIDPFCERRSGSTPRQRRSVRFLGADCIGTDGRLAGGAGRRVFYEKPLADRLLPWFAALKARGAEILIGDRAGPICRKGGWRSSPSTRCR